MGRALTEREREVLALVAAGADDARDRRRAAPERAHGQGYVSAIFLELGARDRAAAIIHAYDAGLAPPLP